MASPRGLPPSFLGRGWGFPPEFSDKTGDVRMTADEEDIAASLAILFGTALVERFLVPAYGLDMHEVLFEPVSTTLRTFLKDRVHNAILIYEPRITLLTLEIANPDQIDGSLRIFVEYEIRATNSRYNLVFPFYRTDSSELRRSVDRQAAGPPPT